MKIPDKIYLNKYMFRTGMFYKAQNPITPDIEYIRKDALMKWLEGKVNLSYGVATDAFVEVIDKLKSL